jgi:hypothetical protein
MRPNFGSLPAEAAFYTDAKRFIIASSIRLNEAKERDPALDRLFATKLGDRAVELVEILTDYRDYLQTLADQHGHEQARERFWSEGRWP